MRWKRSTRTRHARSTPSIASPSLASVAKKVVGSSGTHRVVLCIGGSAPAVAGAWRSSVAVGGLAGRRCGAESNAASGTDGTDGTDGARYNPAVVQWQRDSQLFNLLPPFDCTACLLVSVAATVAPNSNNNNNNNHNHNNNSSTTTTTNNNNTTKLPR